MVSKRNTSQGELFGAIDSLATKVVTRRKDFEGLFEGFKKLKAVSYVVSPSLLLDFFTTRGYEEVEIVVGENLTDAYKNELEQKGTETIEKLRTLVEKGKLRVLVPDRTIHTKLFILEKEDAVRVVQTSANLTETAQDARRQINYAWYLDLPKGHIFLKQILSDYDSHRKECTPFMEDLNDLVKKTKTEEEKKQAIEFWLKGVVPDEQNVETKRVFNELTLNISQSSNPKEEQVFVLRLPDAPKARRQVEHLLEPLKPIFSGENQVQVSSSAYIRHIFETHHIPLMVLNKGRQELLLGIDGQIRVLTEKPAAPDLVDKALAHIESYINTVDSGTSTNHLAAKMSMYEALLYIFFTPFAHEYMKAKRARYGRVERRGPRFLYIYGPSHNGKTTFLRFSLKLLTGRNIETLRRQDFSETKIMSTAIKGTSFPLVFDDVNPSGTNTYKIEDVFKSYWEQWWQEEFVSPQIVLASNTPRLKEWAKSRVKRVDFDVHFAPTEADKAKLNDLFAVDNPLFQWFSYFYIGHLADDRLPSDDELYLARLVIKELYEYATRPLPKFFPSEPVEKIFDSGKRDWNDLIHRLKKATSRQQGNRLLIEFSKDMQPWEVKDYQGYLPQTVKSVQKGSTLIIENPAEFKKWLGGESQKDSWIPRLFKRINSAH